MANRNFASGGKIYMMHVSPVLVDCTIQIGASGVVTSFTSSLVASVAHTSTGVYTITLQDPYSSVLSISGSMQSPASGLSGIVAVEGQNAPNTNISSLTAPTIAVKTLSDADALADPASGSALTVLMLLSNSQTKVGTSI